MDVPLPEPKMTAHIEVRRITIDPHHTVGRHGHNGPVVGYIVDGTVIFQIEGQAETRLTRGHTFFEPANIPIARFDAEAAGVTFLAWFLLDTDEQPAMYTPK